MAESGFGAVLRALRERRQLSLRELSTLAETDHAYVSKIERGEKEAPPKDTFARLVRHLKATAHQISLLQFLAEHQIREDLALHALAHEDVDFEDLTVASTIKHRGPVRPEPATLIDRAKRARAILDEP